MSCEISVRSQMAKTNPQHVMDVKVCRCKDCGWQRRVCSECANEEALQDVYIILCCNSL